MATVAACSSTVFASSPSIPYRTRTHRPSLRPAPRRTSLPVLRCLRKRDSGEPPKLEAPGVPESKGAEPAGEERASWGFAFAAAAAGALVLQGPQQALAGTQFMGLQPPADALGDLGDISTGFSADLLLRARRQDVLHCGDILNCNLKKGSSYTWQSIWAGIQTFKRGNIWRVGDGTQINIWDDAWIPTSPNRKIATRRGNIVYTLVSELIDQEEGIWDEELIRQLFWPIDAERILNIPLAHGMMNDFVSWHLTKSGTFSVRSAYFAEWEHQHGHKLRRTTTYGTSSTLPVWKTLWSLHVPAKIKIHVWRALLGAIPCNGVLANRHMQTSSQCQLCTTDCESVRHVFFMCPRVKEIFSHLGLVELISHMCERDDQGSSVLESLLRNRSAKAPRLPEVDRNDLIATAVWYIWWERRKATHGEPVQTPARSAQAISNLALSYYRAKKKKSGIVRHGWKKPKEEFVKLNVDAGFDLDSGTGSTGSIIRDDRGYFIAASSRGIPFVSDASTAEAYALRDGLILAGQMGCNRIEVNSDCMEVIEVMQNGGSSLGPAAAIYEECSFLCRNFVEVCFYHCPREANEAADTLARRAEGSMSIVWQDDPPAFLISVLATDVTIMPNE